MANHPQKICIISGHPHNKNHFVPALSDAYEKGALKNGHTVNRIDVCDLKFDILRSPEDFKNSAKTADITSSQNLISESDHIVFLFPMWLGGIPAYTRAFLEQLACGNFFLSTDSKTGWPKKMMKEKSIRIVMTMGMPAIAYKLFFGAHTILGIEKNIFGISGFKPIHRTLIGSVDALGDKARSKWLTNMYELGSKGR